MLEMLIILGLTFGFFALLGLIEKIPVVNKLLEKGVKKLERR